MKNGIISYKISKYFEANMRLFKLANAVVESAEMFVYADYKTNKLFG